MNIKNHRIEVKQYQDFLREIKNGDKVLLEVYSPEDEDKKEAGLPDWKECWRYYTGVISIDRSSSFFDPTDPMLKSQFINLSTGEADCGSGVRIVPVTSLTT